MSSNNMWEISIEYLIEYFLFSYFLVAKDTEEKRIKMLVGV